MLLGVVNGLHGELSLLLCLLQLVEGISVLFLQILELLELVKFGLVDDLVLASVAGTLDETFSAGVDIWGHGGGQVALFPSVLLLLKEVPRRVDPLLQHVAAICVVFDVHATFKESGPAL